MTYHDQPYYKEFRDLLTRIQSGVNDLKEENQDLKEENVSFSSQLKELRGELAKVRKENELLKKNESSRSAANVESSADHKEHSFVSSHASNPSLFSTLDDNEKRILRQQIVDLINRIDLHLDRKKSGGRLK